MKKRNILELEQECLKELPNLSEYVHNTILLRDLENKILQNFVPSWNELSTILNDKSTAFVDNFVFKLGYTVYDKPNAIAKPYMDILYADKKAILNQAVQDKQALIIQKPNFIIKLPGYTQEPKLPNDIAHNLIQKLPNKKSKIKSSLNSFSSQYPIATPTLLLKNKYRLLEKRQQNLWNLACKELHLSFNSKSTLRVSYNNTTVTIAKFNTPHIELTKGSKYAYYKLKLATMYSKIKDLHNSFILDGKTEKAYTLFFTSYTI